MLARISQIEDLVQRYDDDPAHGSRLLRNFATEKADKFLSFAVDEILVERPPSRALKYLSELAISAGLLEYIIELYRRSREQAIALASKVLLCNPRFFRLLLEHLRQPSLNGSQEEVQVLAGLDLLNVLSKDERFVPDVLRLLNHPNPKVRSKAALFVGSRTQNLTWAAKRSEDKNDRVRANILESLFGLQSDLVHQMFRDNVADGNNRVAGNAVLGLYLLGDTASFSLIYEMAVHREARFRNTCAWLMGKVRDPRFSQMLSGFMSDPDETVRRQALKSLGEVRRVLKEASFKPQWETVIIRSDNGAETNLIATVHDSAGAFVNDIPATAFIVRTGAPPAVVRDFRVEEYNKAISLSVGFVISLPSEGDADAEAQLTLAIKACSDLRRSKDQWAVLKVIPYLASHQPADLGPAVHRKTTSILDLSGMSNFAAPVKKTLVQKTFTLEYSADQDRIDAMMNASPVSIDPAPNEEISDFVPKNVFGSRHGKDHSHLIFLGASSSPDIAAELFANRSTLGARVHVLAVSNAWQIPDSAAIASSTGGIYKKIPNLNDLPQVCSQVYASLLQHYRITWKEGAGDIHLDIHAAAGRGTAAWAFESNPGADQA